MMSKLTLVTFLISISFYSIAQNCYDVVQVPYQPAPFVGTNVISDSSNALADDVFSPAISIGFSFCFFNAMYDTLLISTNGYITFDLSQANQYSPWQILNTAPSPFNPLNSIMSPWQDLLPPSGGTISYELQGIAPYRRFVVSYDKLAMYQCTGMFFSNQLILYETTNIIEMNIKEKPVCYTWNDGAAIEGIQNSDGSEAYVVPGRNYPGQWTAAYDSWRFIPLCGCAGPAPSDLIAGKIFADYNNDCIYNGNDLPIPNQTVLANGSQFYAYTDSNGDYKMSVDTGTYEISHSILPYFTSKCPTAGTYSILFTSANDTIPNTDFADTTDVLCSDLSVDIGVPNLTQCYFEYGGITYCNNGTVPESNAVIIISLPDSLEITSSSVPAIPLGNGQYQISPGAIAIGECGFISFTMNVGCDTVGTVLCINATIQGSVSDCDSTNNSASDCHSIISSFDPNGKEVASHDFENQGYVTIDSITSDDDLTYLIHFQNTGSDTAYNIIVRDTLSGYLDPTSIQPGASSHPYTWLMQNGVLIMQFNNIKLPDSTVNPASSMGFIKFNVRQQPGNLPGTIVSNKAAIYFDYNLPVITNITLNIIPDDISTSIQNMSLLNIAVFPNPFHDRTEIVVDSDIKDLQLIINDVSGKRLMQFPVVNNHVVFSRGNLPNGIYFFTIEKDGRKMSTGKLIVE